MTLDQAFRIYMADVTGAHPDAKLAEGPFGDAVATRPGGPPPIPRRTARMTYRETGQEVFSRLSVALVGEWIVEQRFTGPKAKAAELDAGAELLMMMAVDRAAGRI
jgi:hypothetical protein